MRGEGGEGGKGGREGREGREGGKGGDTKLPLQQTACTHHKETEICPEHLCYIIRNQTISF